MTELDRTTPTRSGLSRRGFLSTSALALGGLAAAAAGARPGSTGPMLLRSAAGPDWNALQSDLAGTLLRPADNGYDQWSKLFNSRWDNLHPAAVARVSNAHDVQTCVQFAKSANVPLTVRAGGHSYAGYSSGPGLVVDVRGLNAVDVGGGSVTVGSGVQNIDAYKALADEGYAIPAGSCPSVGLTGLTLGGGLGVMNRQWGLTCDSLMGGTMVTADGRIRRFDAFTESDLFWASQGGGGGNFGVVTELKYTTRWIRDKTFTTFFLNWKPEQAVQMVRGWQKWIRKPSTPRAIWASVHFLSYGATPTPQIVGVLMGSPSDLEPLLADLAAEIGAEPANRTVTTKPYLETALLWANCVNWGDLSTWTVPQCHAGYESPGGQVERVPYAAKSHIVRGPMSDNAIGALYQGVKDLFTIGGAGGVLVDPLGGAVADYSPNTTAFPHRGALATVQYLSEWSAETGQADIERRRQWLRDYHSTMQGFLGDGGYVNYIDNELPTWKNAYYGANYGRLQQIKAKYDPSGFFNFAQGVKA